MSLKDGDPAFPSPYFDWHSEGGMSLRDWFAGQSMMGFLSNGKNVITTGYLDMYAAYAAAAFHMADAMLTARKRGANEEST